jgi:hypothetical protein
MDTLVVYLFFGFVLLGWITITLNIEKKACLEAESAFLNLMLTTDTEQFKFDGSQATTVYTISRSCTIGHYSLERISKNTHKEYFYIAISGQAYPDGTPVKNTATHSIKHLSIERAQLVLSQYPKAYKREFGKKPH